MYDVSIHMMLSSHLARIAQPSAICSSVLLPSVLISCCMALSYSSSSGVFPPMRACARIYSRLNAARRHVWLHGKPRSRLNAARRHVWLHGKPQRLSGQRLSGQRLQSQWLSGQRLHKIVMEVTESPKAQCKDTKVHERHPQTETATDQFAGFSFVYYTTVFCFLHRPEQGLDPQTTPK